MAQGGIAIVCMHCDAIHSQSEHGGCILQLPSNTHRSNAMIPTNPITNLGI